VDLEPYRELDHTADVALKARGRELADLLRNAADGMIALAGFETEPEPCGVRHLRLWATDSETLLVTWLEEILSQAEAEHTLLQGYTLRVIGATELEVEAATHPIRRVAKEIKAVTFHGLVIRSVQGGLEATIVFDV
jgi:SHS2 domain-containing protein